MQINKLLTYAAALAIALIILLSGAFVIVPEIDKTVAVRAEMHRVDAENDVKSAQNGVLAEKFASIDVLRAELGALNLAIPISADTPTVVRQLSALADAHGVTLDSISVSAAGAAVPEAAAPVDPAVPVDPAAPVDPAVSVDPTAPVDLAAPAAPAAVLLSVPVALTVSGQSAAILNFIHGLQTSDRIISVTGFTTSLGAAAGAVGGSVTASISTVLYALPAA